MQMQQLGHVGEMPRECCALHVPYDMVSQAYPYWTLDSCDSHGVPRQSSNDTAIGHCCRTNQQRCDAEE